MADEITIRLNGDSSSYRSSMSDAYAVTDTTLGRIEERLVGTRAIATAIGTALGINLQAIAQNVARFVIGFSQEQEAALKTLDEETERGIALQAQLASTRLTGAQQEQSLANDIAKLWKQVYEVQGTSILDAQAKQGALYNQITEKEIQIASLKKKDSDEQKQAQDDFAKKQDDDLQKTFDTNEKIFEQDLKSEGVYQQQADLKAKIAQIEQQLSTATEGTAEYDAIKKQLAQDTILLNNTELEVKKQITLSSSDEHEFLLLQAKQLADNITPAESARLAVLKLQTQELHVQSEIDSILQTSLDQRTQIQKNQLVTLLHQKTTLHAQLATAQSFVPADNSHLKALYPITAELQKQLDTLNQINSNQNLLTNAKNTTYQFDGISIAGSAQTTAQLQSLSDAVLQKIITNAQANISTLENNKFTDASSGAEAASGFLARGSAEDVLSTTVTNAQNIIAQRNKFRGEDYNTALSQFTGNPADFDNLYKSAQEQSSTLATISAQLANSGIFPAAGPTNT